MSKKGGSGGVSGWKYRCTCGYETLQVSSAVAHINSNKDHQLTRQEL
ncbi:MAG: hypothetical protein HY619_05005 [Thaumarchaeota archaeon]|nr:hypothetical protein [Nitrososphaerota archaeon]